MGASLNRRRPSPVGTSIGVGMMIGALVSVLGAAALVACGDDGANTKVAPELVSLGIEQGDTLTVEMLAEAPLEVGLNRVFYKVTRRATGERVRSATISQVPVMHMAMMNKEHSCPCEQPPVLANEDGLFPAVIVFQMATGTTGDSWRNEVTIETALGAPQVVVFEGLAVAESSARKDLPIPDGMGGSAVAVVTFNLPRTPRVGFNDLVVTVHKKGDMTGMVWNALDDLTITAVPDMPSMGHGSPGNVNPVHVTGGRYEGRLNFTMPGVWRVVLTLSRGDTALGTLEYTLTL